MTLLNARIQKIEDELKELYGDDAVQELVKEDPVRNEITYHRLVSRSKGIRNGKRRYRKFIKVVRLLKRTHGYKFTQWHHFQFDQEATEIGVKDGEDLKERIDDIWGY